VKILLTTGMVTHAVGAPGPVSAARGQDLEVWVLGDDGTRMKLNNVLSLTMRCDGRQNRLTVELVLQGVEVENVVAELRALDTFDELAARARDSVKP
jgi:hypothetical protein